jgi:tRNA threonylcarbamoyladenosine biosynthesis protein TsaB
VKTLFIDTSLSNLVIGIVNGDDLLYIESNKLSHQLSTYTLPRLVEVFNNCHLKPNDIDTIMVIEGPGSFTGLRIGITIAKIMAWTLNKKIIPISSLHAMALSVNDGDYIIPVIDARSNSYYASIYDNDLNLLMEPQYISKDKLLNEIKKLKGNLKIISDHDFYLADLKVNEIKLDVLNIVKSYINHEGISVHKLVPNYLKLTDAERKLYEKCD